MTNKAIARQLQLAADLLELTGGNPFRARAYAAGARAVERLEEPAAERARAGTLTDVPGIGKTLSAEIQSLVETGRLEFADRLIAGLPPGLPEVLRVKGLGVKKVRQVWQELGVASLDDLEAAALSGALAGLPGFGEKTAENVLASIEQLKRYRGKRRYADAAREIEAVLDRLRRQPGVVRAEAAGAYRRQLEVVDRVVLVVDGEAEAVRAALETEEVQPSEAPAEGAFFSGRMPLSGLPVTVFRPAPESFGRALWAATGSDAHVAAFVDRYGMPGEAAEEGVVFSAAGLAFISPALREGDGEIEAAAEGRLPRLVTVADLRGSLHNHSTWSDGAHSVREMAEAARARGLEYFGLCDHSRSLQVANGLSVERLLAQIAEVRALNAEYAAGGVPFRVFAGTECDVLADGQMDFPDEVLARLDLVVASVHTRFDMTEAEATARVVRAVENPYVDILGHPTARLLLRREGYPLDHRAVLDACAATGTAVELNANPWRLDVDWRWLRYAAERGVLVSINPDAHHADELDNVAWGVRVAQKGWLTPEGTLNALPADALAGWLAARRRRAGVPQPIADSR